MERVVDNRYTILSELGSGGAGDVFLARDEVLGREVALKMLGPHHRGPDFVERFEREARSTASLSHPNVVAVHDLGEIQPEEASARRGLYIVMEYVPGITLAELIRERAPLDPRVAASICLRAARGLEAAHARSIIHRDVKPANILLSSSSREEDVYSGKPEVVKVTDFGISRRLSDSTLTEQNAVMGTAHYLSPEQAMGHSLDHRSDLYSLGVVLYEALAGRRPFEAGESDSPLAVAMKHVIEIPVPPASVNPSVPLALNELTLRLLGKDPEERPGSASELAEALSAELATTADLTRAETSASGKVGDGGGKYPPTVVLSGDGAGGELPESRRRVKYVLPALAVPLVLALVAVVAGVGLPNPTGEEEPRASSVRVPEVEGGSLEEARRVANGEVEIEVVGRRASEEPVDTVLAAAPEAERQVRRGAPVEVVLSDGPRSEGTAQEESPEEEEDPPSGETPREGARLAAEDYYEAVDRRDWAYTYESLDSRSRGMFDEGEWYRKNQHIAETDQLYLDSLQVEVSSLSGSDDYSEVDVHRTFDGGYELERDTVFVYEDGEWRHRLVGEELVFFMPGASYEEFAETY